MSRATAVRAVVEHGLGALSKAWMLDALPGHSRGAPPIRRRRPPQRRARWRCSRGRCARYVHDTIRPRLRQRARLTRGPSLAASAGPPGPALPRRSWPAGRRAEAGAACSGHSSERFHILPRSETAMRPAPVDPRRKTPPRPGVVARSGRECGNGVGDGNSVEARHPAASSAAPDRQVGRGEGRARRQRGPADRRAGRGQDRAARPHADRRPGRAPSRRRSLRKGSWSARELVGNINASEAVEIRESGAVDGDIVSPRVAIADGAHFRGSIDMQRKGQAPAKGAAAPESPRPGRFRRVTARNRQGADRVGRREQRPRWPGLWHRASRFHPGSVRPEPGGWEAAAAARCARRDRAGR